jgi:phospholipid/cholesterol/gamma-HCH transport system permease protein
LDAGFIDTTYPRDQSWRDQKRPDRISVNRILIILSAIGRAVIVACSQTGKVAVFAGSGLSHLFRPPFYGRLFLNALLNIGYFSLPVVALTAVFTGMVLALQSYTGFARFSAQGAVANLVVLSVTRELGPVLAGLMVAGRVGAAMAAELGTMRVTDQIDALTTLSTNPMKYLVAPRLLAGIIALPLLVLIADILGVMGGFIVSTVKLGFNQSVYLTNTVNFVQTEDVVSGLAKAGVFGFLIALMGCYQGYNSKGGAQGVGAATTAAVVSASILILAFDYVMTEMFFSRA